ncbi:MAG: HAD-IIA family hydrolase [Acidimicrobiales bacterium]
MIDDSLPRGVLCDMDGVLIRDDAMIKGADEFLNRLEKTGRDYLVVTNNSLYSPRVLQQRLESLGLSVARERLWTSPLATARFVSDQRPRGTAFIIGENCLHEALADVGYRERSEQVDFVVLGETWDYCFDEFVTAIRLLEQGGRFVATNPEASGAGRAGTMPGCGAMAALLERASGVTPFFVGKPNPLMLLEAARTMGSTSATTLMIGDRMDTDVLAATQAGMASVLVLTGVSDARDAERYPYRPNWVVDSVADLIDRC